MGVEEKLKAIYEYIKKADAGDLTERERAENQRLPHGCSYGSWLDDIEACTKTLPDNLPRMDAIRKYVPLARQALADGRKSDLHLFISRLNEAYSDIQVNRMSQRGFIAETAGRNPAWYTRPLIEMCQNMRKQHPNKTSVDMYYDLPDLHGIDPIDEIRMNGMGEMTIVAGSESSHTNKNMTLESFKKFCSKHKLEIGNKLPYPDTRIS